MEKWSPRGGKLQLQQMDDGILACVYVMRMMLVGGGAAFGAGAGQSRVARVDSGEGKMGLFD